MLSKRDYHKTAKHFFLDHEEYRFLAFQVLLKGYIAQLALVKRGAGRDIIILN
jgi:hypothetical protein